MSYFDDGVFRVVLDNEQPWGIDTACRWLWPIVAANLGIGSIGGAIG